MSQHFQDGSAVFRRFLHSRQSRYIALLIAPEVYSEGLLLAIEDDGRGMRVTGSGLWGLGITSMVTRAALRHYLSVNNRDPKPFVWTKTADQILESIK